MFKVVSKLFYFLYSKFNKIGYVRAIGVHFGDNLHIYGDAWNMFGTEPWCISLGNNVHITKEVLFITHDGGTLLFRSKFPDLEITKKIKVGNNVYIGVRSIILPGVSVGNNCIIAAGSVVTKSIPDNCVYGGVPAKFIKSIDDYLEGIQKKSLKVGQFSGKRKDELLKGILGNP